MVLLDLITRFLSHSKDLNWLNIKFSSCKLNEDVF